MRFLLDQNQSPHLTQLLGDQGHDAVHVRDLGLHAATDDEILDHARDSTPAYKPVLDLHGWGDLQPKLRQMTKDNKWDQLGEPITDEMLETFAAVGEPAEAAAIVRDRVGGVVDSVVLDSNLEADALAAQMAVLRED